jgi:hypothetical protein
MPQSRRHMSSSTLATALAAALLLVGATSLAVAGSLTRPDFPKDAVEFDFGSAGAGTLTDGFLTVSNVTFDQNGFDGVDWGDFEPANATEDRFGTEIRFDFLQPVWAFGTDFIADDTCTPAFFDPVICTTGIVTDLTLSLFDSSDALIESLTVDITSLPRLPTTGPNAAAADFPYGFLGLDAGSEIIAYATLSSALPADLALARVNNVIYVRVPEPASLMLFGAALAGLGYARQRRR